MRQSYDRVAEEFAARNSAMPDTIAQMGRLFVQRLQAARPVLDIGCGTGRDLAWLGSQGVDAIGADLSVGMLQQARLITGCPLVQADMLQLPFGEGSFSGVWCMAALLHLPKKDVPGALAEMRRVAVTGAPLLVALQEGSTEGWEKADFGAPGRVERFFSRYSEVEASALLADAGYIIVEHRREDAKAKRWLHFLAVSAG